MNVTFKELTIVVDNITFTKVIGDYNIYCEEYGIHIPGSEDANDFNKMIIESIGWLAMQD